CPGHPTGGNGPHPRGDARDERRLIRGLERAMDDVVLVQSYFDLGHHRFQQQQIRLHLVPSAQSIAMSMVPSSGNSARTWTPATTKIVPLHEPVVTACPARRPPSERAP